MARTSREVAARHHTEIIKAASRLFRERGVRSATVPDVMEEVGMTRGGFYRHFESKEALVAAAVEATFEEYLERLDDMCDEDAQDPAGRRAAFMALCLSTNHENPTNGCLSSLASAIGYIEQQGTPREAFTRGLRLLMAELAAKIGVGKIDDDAQLERNLADLSTIVGALLLSRATAGDPISDVVLAAARRRIE